MKNFNNKKNNEAMTLPELVLAVFMLTAFTGVTVMVTKYTSRFFQSLEGVNERGNISINSNFKDIIQDHKEISYAFDSIVETLSQPGINKQFISNLKKCTTRPWDDWSINSIDKEKDEKGIIKTLETYEICIKSSMVESNYQGLVNGGKPGIYILYAKPIKRLSVNALPVRRIFCRPKPFCKVSNAFCKF